MHIISYFKIIFYSHVDVYAYRSHNPNPRAELFSQLLNFYKI